MTRREAPLSVLRDLAETVCALNEHPSQAVREHLDDLISTYRAATAQLRSRAEVDAEIIPLLRQHVVRITGMTKEQMDGIDFRHAWDRIKELCREPTSDPNPSGPGGESAPSPAVERALSSDEPEPCGCEQSEALRKRLANIRSMTSTYSSADPVSALAAIRSECG